MTTSEYPRNRIEKIVVQEMNDEVLIYDLEKNKAFCLNQTSAIIWRECDGKNSVADIAGTLSKKLRTPINEDLVWMAVSQFRKDDLLADSNELLTPLDGLSRREVVKRIGYSTMVALPLIASVTAPSAIRAQSGCIAPSSCTPPINAASMQNLDDGCFCLSNLNCLTGICPVGTMVCSGGGIPAAEFCNQVGNNVRASAPCCPCQSNLDCIEGICPVGTMTCADI